MPLPKMCHYQTDKIFKNRLDSTNRKLLLEFVQQSPKKIRRIYEGNYDGELYYPELLLKMIGCTTTFTNNNDLDHENHTIFLLRGRI